MIQYMIQVAMAMALLIIPYLLFFRNETFFRFNRAYLLSALIISIIAPFAPRWISVTDPSMAFVLLQPIEISSMGEVIVEAGAMQQGPDVWSILSLGYWIVAMVFIGRLIIEISGIARIYQGGEVEFYNGEKIVVHQDVKAPFSFFNTVFLSPEIRNDYARFSKIFNHEATHIKLNHSFDAVLVELLCALFWINPLIYIYKRALKAVHEFQADNIVEEADLIEYSQLLLAQSQSGLRLALTNQFFQSQLKSRITMMMKQRSHEVNKWKYLFALPVLAISIVLFSFKNSDAVSIDRGEMYSKHIAAQDSFPKAKDGVYMVVDEMPRFPGCEEMVDIESKKRCAMKLMLNHVYHNIKYPAEAKKNNIEGTVVVQFVVNKSGEVVDVRVVRGIGGGCDEESLRVVSELSTSAGNWTPGKMNGEVVKVQMTLPIKFKLTSDKAGPAKVKVAGGQSDDGKCEVYKVVEVMPLFPGTDNMQASQKQLIEYIGANLKYPERAKAENLEGRVVVTFIVEPNGKIAGIHVPKGLSPECDAEVIRVLESMNSVAGDWTPGMQDGEKVRVQFALPVSFKL